MHISVKGDYALHAVFDLSLQRPGDPVKIADIARRQRIPQKFLELILSGLKQGGFVESRRGAEGGYLLARPADAIMVGEVLRFMEGAKSAKNGARERDQGPFASLWTSVDVAVSDVVDHTSFGDLARAWRERQGTYVPNWDI
jgi:Rrf2 family transcriptional regulator, cysteine metabolism repressor